MWSFIGWVFLSLVRYMLSLGIVVFIVSPLVKFSLIHLFERLPRSGAGHALRQSMAVPIVGLLSRERRARRGDHKSLFQLFMLELSTTFVISFLMQGLLATVIFTGIFASWAYWLLRNMRS